MHPVNRNSYLKILSFCVLISLLVLTGLLGGPSTVVAQGEEPPPVDSNKVKPDDTSTDAVTPVHEDNLVAIDCFPGTSITMGEVHTWNNGGSGSGDLIDYYPVIHWYESGPEFTYSYVQSVDGTVTVRLSGMIVDLDIFVIAATEAGGCSSALTLDYGNSFVSFDAMANKTYFFVVDGYMGVEGDYTISVSGPLNDDITSPYPLTEIPYEDVQYTTTATHEAGDPSFAACGQATGLASLWYKAVPISSGVAYIDTLGSNYNTMLGVWSGLPGEVPDEMTLVACNNDANGTQQSKLTVNMMTGYIYYIGVAQKGTSETGGIMRFHLTSFADVPGNHPLWRYVEGFLRKGITTGCATNPMRYCPDQVVTRAQMAVFILRALHSTEPGYIPPNFTPNIFADVPEAGKEWMEPFIESFYMLGITTGCAAGPLRYCPERNVTRGEMAVFMLRATHGSSYVPPPATGTFVDVPATNWMQPWIEQFYDEGITTGCGGSIPGVDLKYCPVRNVNRAEMATFIDRVFSFPPLP